jgi:antitoxin component YwqK of YwqJK toxin-antitoxin module
MMRFSVSDDPVNTVQLKSYYWFKARAVHHAIGGYSGQLLHGEFSKYYLSNQLAAQGVFQQGLKNGVWKAWFENGNLKMITRWKNGLQHGIAIAYAENGTVRTKGRYTNNMKQGEWIDFEKKDTLRYKKGELVVVKEKQKDTTKSNIFNRLFQKKSIQ